MKTFLFIWPFIAVFMCAFLGILIGIMISEKTYIEEGGRRMVSELCQRQNYDFCSAKDEIIRVKADKR